MKKVAFDGDLFNVTSDGHTDYYMNPIDESATSREKFWGKVPTPLLTSFVKRSYVRRFGNNFADTSAKKPTPILLNQGVPSKKI